MTAKIKLNAASGGGSISIQAPSSSSNNRVISLPDIADGTLLTSQSSLDSTKLSPAISAGITQADQWRMSSGYSYNSGTLEHNWERNDTDFTLIGSGMSESSGIWTFPATGIYQVNIHFGMYKANTNVRYMGGYIYTTTDNANFNARADGYGSVTSSSNSYTNLDLSLIFDVTDTSTHKVRFNADAEVSVTYDGHSSRNRTFATFIKLGDT
tara:strand:- start:270 stop:902 length:633 start_codon:yes stop_codon:yes gene_type:complete